MFNLFGCIYLFVYLLLALTSWFSQLVRGMFFAYMFSLSHLSVHTQLPWDRVPVHKPRRRSADARAPWDRAGQGPALSLSMSCLLKASSEDLAYFRREKIQNLSIHTSICSFLQPGHYSNYVSTYMLMLECLLYVISINILSSSGWYTLQRKFRQETQRKLSQSSIGSIPHKRSSLIPV